MDQVTLARNAMATRFEFLLFGENPARLRAAGEEALDEIDRLEEQLSIYRPGSEISQLNRRAASEAVRVSPPVFELLRACGSLSELTGGTFDITVAPLVRCWGFMKGPIASGNRPSETEIDLARAQVGMHLLEFDEDRSTIRFNQPGVMLDLGAVGKGYALDAAMDILRENGISTALLHGGTSTVCGLGENPEGGPWKVAIELPSSAPDQAAQLLSIAELKDQCLSVSAVWGKAFEIDGVKYGHVIDPRTGWPARHAVLGAAVVNSAAVSDALSTGVLLGNEEILQRLVQQTPGLRYLQVSREPSAELRHRAHGLELRSRPISPESAEPSRLNPPS